MNSYSYKDVTKIVIKNIVWICISAVVFGLIFGLYAHKKKSTSYTASRSVMVVHNLNRTEYKNSMVQADKGLTGTYADMMTDHAVIKKAHQELPKKLRSDYSVDDMSHVVDTKTKDDSLIIKVSATTSNAKNSVKIVNAVTDCFKKQLPKIDPYAGQVRLLSKATNSDTINHTGPSTKKYLVLGVAIGILFGMLIAFMRTSSKHLIKK